MLRLGYPAVIDDTECREEHNRLSQRPLNYVRVVRALLAASLIAAIFAMARMLPLGRVPQLKHGLGEVLR